MSSEDLFWTARRLRRHVAEAARTLAARDMIGLSAEQDGYVIEAEEPRNNSSNSFVFPAKAVMTT